MDQVAKGMYLVKLESAMQLKLVYLDYHPGDSDCCLRVGTAKILYCLWHFLKCTVYEQIWTILPITSKFEHYYQLLTVKSEPTDRHAFLSNPASCIYAKDNK